MAVPEHDRLPGSHPNAADPATHNSVFALVSQNCSAPKDVGLRRHSLADNICAPLAVEPYAPCKLIYSTIT